MFKTYYKHMTALDHTCH